jgi:hypothetical protein
MDFIKHIRVSEECPKAKLGAMIDRSAAILDVWKIGWVRITEFSSAQGDEAGIFLLIQRMFRHLKIKLFKPPSQREATQQTAAST